jgi:pimeloyl-ACP methyl ester carboxylesterase
MARLVTSYGHRQRPGIEYTVDSGRYVAYATFGSGDTTLLLLGGLATHLEGQWEEPHWASWTSHLAGLGAVVTFDKRGTGLSDSISDTPTIDDFVHDSIQVLDAVGAGEVVVIACAEAGLFAPRLAVVDERIRGMVLINAVPKIARDTTFEIGVPTSASHDFFGGIQRRWGSDAVALDLAAPSMVDDPDFVRWAGRYQRLCTTPGNLRHLAVFSNTADARADIERVLQPTLVLQSAKSRYFSPRNASWLADHLVDHHLVWLDSADHLYWLAQPDQALDEIKRFVSALSGH